MKLPSKQTITADERCGILKAIESLNTLLYGKTVCVESLDGKPLTAVEKEAVRKFRAGIPFAEAECGTWRALSPGEDALIKAIRRGICDAIDADDTVVICRNGKAKMTYERMFTLVAMEDDRADKDVFHALKQIKAEQEANNGAE